MKILIFNFEYPPLGGGGADATQRIAEELAHRHTVHVVTSRHADLPPREVTARVVIHRVPVLGRTQREAASLVSLVSFVPSALWAGWRILRQEHFDIINAQFVVPSGVPAAVLARLFSTPLVVSFIGGDVYDPTKGTSPHRHWWLRWLVRMIARAARERTAISSDTARRVRELHGVQQAVAVVPLGIHVRERVVTDRAALGLPADVPVFVSVGRLIPRKRYDVLLRAWRDVSAAHLVVIGSGPLAESLKKQAVEFGLSKRVLLTGFVSNERKWEFLSAADGYVSAAEHEGFGLVFLEAMAAGLPIVATDVGGQRDFLADGRNAVLVPPHDAVALAGAVNTLLADAGKRQALAQTNVLAAQDFTVEKTVKQFEAILERASGGSASRYRTQQASV